MRRYLCFTVFLFAAAAHAGSGTLRVGSQVLVVGDSATRVVELLGKPSYKSHGKASGGHAKKGRKNARNDSTVSGEQWQYRQGHGLVSILIADGKVVSIRDDGR